MSMESRYGSMAAYAPSHFKWEASGKLAVITLDRPDRKNPLTFESYAELRDLCARISRSQQQEIDEMRAIQTRLGAPH